MDERQRVISLFKYIRQTIDDKYKPILNVKDELWNKYLDEINLNNKFLYFSCGSDSTSDVILRITRPYSQKTQEDIRVQNLFKEFRELYYKLENESHLYELVFANGILISKYDKNIYHPILIKRAAIDFDSRKDSIAIRDTNRDMTLDIKLISLIENINHLELKNIMEHISMNYYHPFDTASMGELMKSMAKRLHTDSSYQETNASETDKAFTIINRPLLYLRNKETDFIQNLDEMIESIEKGSEVNKSLLNLCGVNIKEKEAEERAETLDDKIRNIEGISQSVLFTKEANKEQLEVAERIANYDTVLVQGPPGTGKTHTIANLLGDILARGKTVLVASQTKKALSVLKSMTQEEIRALCVSTIDDNNEDMEKSIDSITDYISNHSIEELKEKIQKLNMDRNILIERLNETRKKIFSIKSSELKSITIGEEVFSPIDAARFLHDHVGLNKIPGEVKLYEELPIQKGDIDFLYYSNEALTREDEKELNIGLPDPNTILSPEDLEKTIDAMDAALLRAKTLKEEIRRNITLKEKVYLDQNALYSGKADEDFRDIYEKIDYINSLDKLEDWQIKVIVSAKAGNADKKSYIRLTELITELDDYYDRNIDHLRGKRLIYPSDMNQKELRQSLEEMRTRLVEGKKIKGISAMFKNSWKKVLASVSINGQGLVTVEDMDDAIVNINLDIKISELKALFDELIYKTNADFDREKLIENKELLSYLPLITKLMKFYDENIQSLFKLMQDKGINVNSIFVNNKVLSPHDSFIKEMNLIKNDLRKYIELADEYDLKYIPAKAKLDDTLDKLKVDEDNKSDLLLLMNTAIETKYYDSYRDSFENLKKTYEKIKILKKRNELLDKLAAVAPTWKEFIYNRFDIHGLKDAPENIEENWYYKQFDGIITKINRTPYEKYQKMMTWYKKQLYDITKELASNMAWHSFMLKIKDDIEKKQALQGWQLTMKKIGKGTGKQAIGLKKEAKELLKKCQRAVPAWIMTIDKALESLDYNQKFDYLIIDEASQADISSIPILQLAKKAIIVGDDEQVSPQAVGIDQDKQRNLIDMYIKDKVANSHLYDLNSSLYDILKTSFPVLTLKEHFRSVPMIAAYSNFISYDGIIKPLRESSSTKVQPALKLVKLDGIKNEDRVNEAEANYIVDEILRIKDEPDYEGKTIGVISLASEDQAKFIDKLLIEKLSLQDYDRLNILCGRPAAFQGDERDIIFLSTVDSNDKDETLKVLNEGAYDVNKKKYNVAVSRAKDQVVLVTSLDYKKDLKLGDIRRTLIEFFINPEDKMVFDKRNRYELSSFEEDIKKELEERGIEVKTNVEAGLYNIALLAIKDDKKFIVEAEGSEFDIDDETIIDQMEKRDILERVGWNFASIRSTKYYFDPSKAIDDLINDMK